MGELQEIRRFWPRAVRVRLHGHKICVQPSKGSKFTLTKPHVWWCIADQRGGLWTYYERSTLAAAMAAAGFAEREPDKYARQRDQLSRWVAECQRGEGDFFSVTPPQSRQRPRKGVRLGRRGRRLALGASIAEALDLVRQKRLDRGEMGR